MKKTKTRQTIIKEFKKYCYVHINYILAMVRLDFEVEINYIDSCEDCNENGFIPIASIDVEPKYYKATINVNKLMLASWEVKDYLTIHNTLCHELAHCITAPLFQMAISPYKTEREMDEKHEQTTEKIGRLIFKIYELEQKHDTFRGKK